MAKRAFFSVALILGAALAACGGGASPASGTPAASPSVAKPAAASASAAGASGAAAGAKPAGGSASPAASLIPLKAAWNTVSGNQIPVWVAADKGLFRQQGLNVDLTFFEGSVAALPALTTGEVSILQTTPTAAIQGKIKGLDTVVLAAHIPYVPQRLMAVPGINSLDELRGKTIGATKAGSSDDFTLQLVLKQKGMVPNKDVKISYLGSVPAQVAALSNKLVEAIVVSPPSNLQAEKVGGHMILNFLDLKIPYPGDGVVSSRAFVSQRHDVVLKFLEGYVQAIDYIKAHPDDAKQVLGKYTKQDDPEVLEATYQYLLSMLPDKPLPDPAGIQTILSSVEDGQGKNPADFLDQAPMQEALAALGK
jgi:NitT/TauT family transport system substrate-binding protein